MVVKGTSNHKNYQKLSVSWDCSVILRGTLTPSLGIAEFLGYLISGVCVNHHYIIDVHRKTVAYSSRFLSTQSSQL